MNIEGLTCKANEDGSVEVTGPVNGTYDGALYQSAGNREQAVSRDLAITWLEQGRFGYIEIQGKKPTYPLNLPQSGTDSGHARP